MKIKKWAIWQDIVESYRIQPPPGIGQVESSRRLVAFDWLIIGLGLLLILLGLVMDIKNGTGKWFSRFSAITTIACLITANRSLKKHYRKLLQEGRKEWTSEAQQCVDRTATILMILGTMFWAFGDDWLEKT